MKKLSELGISPAPWRFTHDDVIDLLKCGVVYSNDCSYLGVADGNLIAAAPELYDALYDVVDYCEPTHLVPSDRFGRILAKAKAALSKASVEEVAE